MYHWCAFKLLKVLSNGSERLLLSLVKVQQHSLGLVGDQSLHRLALTSIEWGVFDSLPKKWIDMLIG
jgi:hypothetical protein